MSTPEKHNHLTRDIRPEGSGCPACDAVWQTAKKQAPVPGEGDKMVFEATVNGDKVTITVSGYDQPSNAFIALQEIGRPEHVMAAAKGYLEALQEQRISGPDEPYSTVKTLV